MRTILIVDDERNIREGVGVMVRRCYPRAAQILEAADGRRALEIMACRPVDLVITDIRMPHMDGIRLLQESESLLRRPLFWVLSGYNEFSHAQAAMEHGARGYLLKPVDREELREALQKAHALHLDREDERRRRIRQWLHASSPIVSDPRAADVPADVPRPSEPYCVMVVVFDHRCRRSNHANSVTECVLRLRDQVSCESKPVWDVLLADEDAICILVRDDNDLVDELAMQVVDGVTDVGCAAVGISPTEHHFSRIPIAFHAARIATSARCVTIRHPLIYRSTMSAPGSSESPSREVDRLVGRIVELIGVGRPEILTDLVADLTGTPRNTADPCAWLAHLERSVTNRLTDAFAPTISAQPAMLERATRLTDVAGYSRLDELSEDLLSLVRDLDTGFTSAAATRGTDPRIAEITGWIRQNYADRNLTMSVAAERAAMAYSYFSQRFSKATGMSFVAFVKLTRVEAAQALLRTSRLRITEIAERVGFAGRKALTSTFREITGTTPKEYRDRYQTSGR